MNVVLKISNESYAKQIKQDLQSAFITCNFIEINRPSEIFSQDHQIDIVVVDSIFITDDAFLLDFKERLTELKYILYFVTEVKEKTVYPPKTKVFIGINEDYQNWVKEIIKDQRQPDSTQEGAIPFELMDLVNTELLEPSKENTVTSNTEQQQHNSLHLYEDITETDAVSKMEEDHPQVDYENKRRDEVTEYAEDKIIRLREMIHVPIWKRKTLKQKTIGIWSPLHRMGVTSFSLNFSLFISSYSIPTALLEGVTNNQKLKNLLERYSGTPQNWKSYAQMIASEEVQPEHVCWNYEHVHCFPMDNDDSKLDWSRDKIEYLVNGIKYHDLVLVDLPTGQMKQYTLDTLEHLDELWILVNDEIQILQEWKKYIKDKENKGLKCKLIFNQNFEFSKSETLADKMELPLLAKLPSIFEEAMLNQYKDYPLIQEEKVREKWVDSFVDIRDYLFNDIPFQTTKSPNLLSKVKNLSNIFKKKLI